MQGCFGIVVMLVVLGVAVTEKPQYGSAHCQDVLAVDCSVYSPEPVCGYDGKNYVTYQNSCEFAKGICSHHGHSLHAVNEGACMTTTSASVTMP